MTVRRHGGHTRRRRDLLDAQAETGYTGKADFEQLESALRRVFEPGSETIRKAVGHLEAPMMTESFVTVLRARLAGVARLEAGGITDEEFRFARHVHLVAYPTRDEPALLRRVRAAIPTGHV